MKANLYLPFLIVTLSFLSCFDVKASQSFDGKAAWQELQDVLTEQYAYLDRPGVKVDELFSLFEARASAAKNRQEFADISQMMLRHFYDPHLNMGPYNEQDFSVYPTGSDIRAKYVVGKFIFEDVKADAAADLANIRPGAEVVSIESQPVEPLLETMFGREFAQLSQQQITYGVNVALGGYRNQKRTIGLRIDGKLTTHQLPASYESINALAKGPTISYDRLEDIGYIRFNNSLGNQKTVSAFKQAITELLDTKALIIDLRNTPSGGNTGVAEPILGHFADSKSPYQLYQVQENGYFYQEAPMQVAYVEPQQPFYAKPFIVLAGRWTGSMGEGMTIGLDAFGALTIVGAPMADLLGGIKTVQLQKSDSWLELGFERLYHVNTTYREDFEPRVMINPADRDADGNDPALLAAMKIISERIAKRL